MATLPPLKLDDKPLIRVYKGTRSRPSYSGPTYGVPAGALSGGSEDYYQDEDGKEITGFDPKLHSVYGSIGEGGKRLPYGVANSGDVDPFEGQEGTMQQAILNGMPKAAKSNTTASPAATATAVRASAAGPAPQMSIGDQMAADIRKRGGRTAQDAEDEMNAGLRKAYSKSSGFDIDTASGRQASYDAALDRMRPNALQANGLREFKRPDGSVGAYSTLPDAIIPESRANGSAGVTYRERAYGKHFATPEPTGKSGGWFGGGETPMIRSGGNWTGNNPVTGEFKDPEGNIWTGEKAFRNSQLGESGMVETDGIPMDNTPYTPTDEEVAAGKAAGENYDNLTAAVAGNERRLRALKGKTGVIGADGKGAVQSFEPTMSTEDYVRQGINMEAENKDSKVPASWNNWNEKTGGNVNGVWMSPADSEPQAGGNYGNPALINTWTPEAGGRFNGVNMSRADSEPQAGGNYGTPDLIRRMTNTWTPEAGGMYNGQNMSRADSEPQAGGNYGKPLLFPSKTRPISAPSRASMLGARKRPITPWRGYGDQM